MPLFLQKTLQNERYDIACMRNTAIRFAHR